MNEFCSFLATVKHMSIIICGNRLYTTDVADRGSVEKEWGISLMLFLIKTSSSEAADGGCEQREQMMRGFYAGSAKNEKLNKHSVTQNLM